METKGANVVAAWWQQLTTWWNRLFDRWLRLAKARRDGLKRSALQVIVILLALASAMFVTAGTLSWSSAWSVLALYVLMVVANVVIMGYIVPDALALPLSINDLKEWDRPLVMLWGVLFFVIIPALAGLDYRSDWSEPMALAARWFGVLALLVGLALFSWAMITNAYFIWKVRPHRKSKQHVCIRGPYWLVRHPAYLGGIIQSLAVPLVLGSALALILGLLAAILLVVRTGLEDFTLYEELPGYRPYSRRVRPRLFPGLW